MVRQRRSNGFWACAVLGSTLVLGFMLWRAGGLYLGAANIYPADWWATVGRAGLHRRRGITRALGLNR